MARRKQQNPKHLETSQELATSLQNGISASSDSEDDEHVCGKCRAEFLSLSDFLKHKIFCVSKRPVLVYADQNNAKDDNAYAKEADAALSDDDPPTLTAMDCAFPNSDYRNFSTKFHDLPQLVQQLSATNVTLEELRNTTVAVSQHGRTLQESQLAALLSNIHQQQVAQLHVIQELQAQILGSPVSPSSLPLVGTAALTPPQSGSEGAMGVATPNNNQPSAPVSTRTCTLNSEKNVIPPASQNGAMYEPNTLELLQRHTEKALQQTMSSGTFLLSNMGLKKVKDGKADEATQRHRCRFCGKFFGSDSALQIHVRSHTGERPFKCSVCASCFSTKGNLKVHFQRHKERMEVPNDLLNGDFSNPPNLNGEPNVPQSMSDDLDQADKALDFSTTAENNKSPPPNADQANCPSRSITPNEMSALSDDSADISVDGTADDRNDHQEYDDEDDDDRGSNMSATNDNMDGDSDNQIGSLSSPFTSPSFGSFFRPNHFSTMLSDSPACLPQKSSAGSSMNDNVQLHQDPSLYQDLLPRIGSNDNSWESLMEVTETSETSKLQKLVDNIEVADPNQCIICHRVLSCRSALQMHYRTHTGERPFKCKICGRAFTTKGNLKTHMGVHRHKPPSRILHQCPVCHKQFANSIILQQHIRMHTAVTNVALPDQLYFAENKNSTLLPPSYPRPMLLPPQMSNPEPLALTNSDARYQTDNSTSAKTPDSVIKMAKADGSQQQRSCVSSPAASVSSGDGPNGQTDDCSAAEDANHNDTNQVFDEIPKRSSSEGNISPISTSPEENATDDPKEVAKDSGDLSCTSTNSKAEIHNSMQKAEPSIQQAKKSTSPQSNAQEQPQPKMEVIRDHPMLLNLPNDKPLPMTLPSDCPIPLSLQSERQLMSLSVPNSQSEFTASLTALENHVKAINSTTTNPLPFPPPYGLGFSIPPYYRHDYGFGAYSSKERSRSYSPSNSKAVSDTSADDRSTPGSVIKSESPKTISRSSESGALDLTPRGSTTTTASSVQRSSADLKVFTPLAGLPFPPPHTRIGTTCQLCFKTFACQSALEIHYRSHTKERPFKCDVCDRGFSTKGNMKQHMLTHKIRDLPPQLFTSNSSMTTSTVLPATTAGATTTPSKKFDEPSKRSASDSGHSPKRPPGIPKHVCEVCRKPFSSGSALQIHMRTHTGVKPFQCNICSRAFTTKGNLKVHMGTHLSNSGTSRRGRRMSLDISPLSLPLGKPGEYPRPDMFFPYLPPFMKSVVPQQPPKMNEISVIQSAVSREDSSVASLASAIMSTSHASSFVSSNRPMAILSSTAHHIQQQPQQPRADEKIHVDETSHRSPVRSMERCSPSSAQAPELPLGDRSAASWGWKIACNRCNKICSSSADLELHISTEHLKNDAVENLSLASQPKSAA